jgi:hypothetical protein
MDYRRNDYDVSIALAEVKSGELAETKGLPVDNKDVEVYVWGNPNEDDYTNKFDIAYKDINNATCDNEGEN